MHLAEELDEGAVSYDKSFFTVSRSEVLKPELKGRDVSLILSHRPSLRVGIEVQGTEAIVRTQRVRHFCQNK